MVTLIAIYMLISLEEDLKDTPEAYLAALFITLDIFTLCFIFALFSPF